MEVSNMKKFISTLLAMHCLGLCFLVSCNKSENNILENQKDPDRNQQEAVQEQIDSETIAEPEIIEIDYTISYYDILADSILCHNDTAIFENAIDPEFFINKLSLSIFPSTPSK